MNDGIPQVFIKREVIKTNGSINPGDLYAPGINHSVIWNTKSRIIICYYANEQTAVQCNKTLLCFYMHKLYVIILL